ncbi:uncharacterized protein F4812DRAFT_460903 [Daldinia caldariorum]|uniref:uncharacterized protein n=1 Tax=Daldinia caldariorum TaxID=326644 RepID=UPI002008CAE8|nr:uncharacterized protein F4812DRAFT_460903 [Daldinia caldariorum]KAI1465923.1 hypothetical protein F4812DRAFT_460903 [Daldinia caldariorum]
MAQGAVKPKKPSAVSAGRKAKPQPPKTKKGARVTKSKSASAADKLQKKLAGGLVAKTEKLLGERAGHLELIGKGRVKDKDGKGKEENKSKARYDINFVYVSFKVYTLSRGYPGVILGLSGGPWLHDEMASTTIFCEGKCASDRDLD